LDAWKVIVSDVQVLDRSKLNNLPEFITPDVSDVPIMDTASQKQRFEQYGLAFNSPIGWMVQTPPQSTLESPDIVIVGPKNGDSVPAIAIKVTYAKGTLQDEVDKLRNNINPLIEQKALQINRESMTKINDYDAYVLKAVGHFEGADEVEQNIGFSQVLIVENNILYSLQYSNDIKSFDRQEDNFRNILESLEINKIEKRPVGNDAPDDEGYAGTIEEEGGGCLIATAAFGSEMAPQVQFLREIRDNTVMTTQSGTAFMTGFNQFYYSFSPAVADYERENPVFKEAVKVTLTPLLTSLTLLNYVDVDSEQEMLGYGIGIILLNIGMYFVAPAAAIIVIKNRIKHN
jgi:peptidyl-prolyl cis-trans isomerase B (cyclophilin B)